MLGAVFSDVPQAQYGSMADEHQQTRRIPLLEERLVVDKRSVETGRVRIRTVVDYEHALVTERLRTESVTIDRVEIDRDVETAPPVREEGDLLIIPVIEEYLVVEKRLRLKEELHVRRVRGETPFVETHQVRRMRAVVERELRGGDAHPTGDHHDPNDHSPLR